MDNKPVAMFVDFENLRYGLINHFGQEPDLASLVEKAKKYGRPSVMRAYADFSEHPPELQRQLHVVGIEAINIPVKITRYTDKGKEVERIKNSADMVLALDAILEAKDSDTKDCQKTFLIVAGDRDYVKLVTSLRNTFGQRVGIVGVPGSIARDLVTAADFEDPIEVEKPKPVDKESLKREVIAMIRRGPAPLEFWTLRIIDQWCQDSRQKMQGTAKEKRDVIHELLDDNVLVRVEIEFKSRKVNSIEIDNAKVKKYE